MKLFITVASIISLGVVGCSAGAQSEAEATREASALDAVVTTDGGARATVLCHSDAECERKQPGTTCQAWAPRSFGVVPGKCLPRPTATGGGEAFVPRAGGACHSSSQCIEAETCQASVPVNSRIHFGPLPGTCKPAQGTACDTNEDCHGLACTPVCPPDSSDGSDEVHCDAVGSICR